MRQMKILRFLLTPFCLFFMEFKASFDGDRKAVVGKNSTELWMKS